ncbi:hypothetical protein GCM10010193_49680 [Kitasatospora atroaurantiaca]|uniref:DUF11 domain-containing protein n=1 Tax=Kitasatospora atroaurantiaca TaxID=285545 RepID=A0A561EYI4_9ACTN|nr:hypothetical protein [Kitasatospora atroaurantiaca]TWE20657.1 hypothetical protein FB465_5812 [Kitasatospora atroaurantiaca]
MTRGSTRLAAATAALVACVTVTAMAAPSDSDLRVVRLDPDPAAPGGTTTVHGFVANGGPDRTASPFTVLIDLPPGFTAEGPYFPTSCAASIGGHVLSCAFPAGLPSLRTATVLAPVRVGRDVPPGTVAEGHVRVVGVDDRHPADNGTAFTITVR